MRITDIRTRPVSLSSPMSNAQIGFTEMTCSIVAVITDVVRAGNPVIGYAFSSNGRYEVDGLLTARFVPRLLRADPSALAAEDGSSIDPTKVRSILMTNEKPGGHGERSVAVGTLEAAVWDAVAKAEDVPLWAMLAKRFGTEPASDPRVYVYAAGGYYAPGKTIFELQDEIRGYLDTGYESVKIKVGGATIDDDRRRIEAILDVVHEGSRLAVDANARFGLDEAVRFGEAIEPYGLKWYEEPGDPGDFQLQMELGRRYAGAFATGENLFGLREVENLVRYAGLDPARDFLQFDPILAYGVTEYVQTLRMLAGYGWSATRCIPHGGHQLSLHLAAGLGLGGNEAYPAVFGPFGGFADVSIIEDGYINIPDSPGVGFELKADVMAVLRTLTLDWARPSATMRRSACPT